MKVITLWFALVLASASCALLPEVRPPHVIVYVIDTLRADHMGLYGYERDTTPAIDALAAEAVVFENAYAPASWTRPAIGTLFTGVLPSRHGAKRSDQQLRPDIATLAEVLKERGYATYGFTCNPAIDPVFGFGRGFDAYAHYGKIDSDTRIAEVHEPVEQFLAEYSGAHREEPLFLFIHVCAPHAAYAPPAPFDNRFEPRDDSEAERKIALYDGEIAYSDAELRELLDRLREIGLFDDSLFILTSDHGEAFGEHDAWLHGDTLFEEVLRVPLLVRLPGAEHAGERVAERASLADLLPTIRSLLDLPPLPGLDGVDLEPSWLGSSQRDARSLFFELDLRDDLLDALIVDDLKIVDRERPSTEAGVRLYALEADGRERMVDDERLRAALKSMLDDQRSRLRAGLYVELSNPRDGQSEHHVAGRLEIIGGAIEAFDAARSPEHTFTLAQDGTHVAFDLRLRNSPNISPIFPALGGRVRMRLVVSGEAPRLRLAYEVDGAPAEQVRMLRGAAPESAVLALPFETEIRHPALNIVAAAEKGTGARPDLLALKDAPPAGSPVSAHVYVVPDRSAPRVELAPTLRERLRVLGYVE